MSPRDIMKSLSGGKDQGDGGPASRAGASPQAAEFAVTASAGRADAAGRPGAVGAPA